MSAPSSRGRCSTGVQNTLSTASSAPACFATSQSCSRSEISVSGFEGVSRNSSRVLLPDGLLPLLDAGRRDVGRLDAEAAEQRGEELDGGAEHRVRAHHVVAALQVHHGGGEDRGHAGAGGDAGLAALERGEAVLEHGDRRVGVARVHHALAAAEALGGLRGVFEDVARGEVQRLGMFLELAAHLPGAHALGAILIASCP